MLKLYKTKSYLYKIGNIKNNKIKINPYENYTVFNLLLKKTYLLYTGESLFFSGKNSPSYLKKNFSYFIITRKPKSYPFKVIKSEC